MNAIFEKNLACLHENHAALYEDLKADIQAFKDNPQSAEYQLIERAGQPPNLEVKRQGDSPIKLHADDTVGEIRQIFERANLQYPQFVVFFGLGLGHHLQAFYQNRPSNNFVMLLFEKDPQVFLRCLCIYDFSQLLADNSVHLAINKDATDLRNIIARSFYEFQTVSRYLKVVALPSALQLDSEYYQDAASSLMEIRDLTTIDAGNSIEDCMIGYRNISGNVREAIENSGIKRFSEAGKGKTLISVAAGPSLGEHWDKLKDLQDDYSIVVCDVLLKTCLKKGIVPDFVTAVERTPIVESFFEGVEVPEKCWLVAPMLLSPKAFSNYQGKKIIYCPTVQHAQGMGLDFLGVFYPGASVGNLNTAIAEIMGFDRVILIGHDLAYSPDGSRSHVVGTGSDKHDNTFSEEDHRDEPEVLSQDETTKLKTSILWNQFRQHMESLIARTHKSIEWINTSAKGAKIHGAKWMSFEQALELGQIAPGCVSQRRDQIGQKIESEERQARYSLVRSQISKGLESLNKWKLRADEVLKQLDDWEEQIKKAEDQGQSISEAKLNEFLDSMLSIKSEAVNNDPTFYQFGIMGIQPAHLAFERQINEMPGKYSDNYQLKRDFLLFHRRYFKIWQKWLPQFIEVLESIELKDSAPQKQYQG